MVLPAESSSSSSSSSSFTSSSSSSSSSAPAVYIPLVFGSLVVTPSVGASFSTVFVVQLTLAPPFPNSDALWLLFSYAPLSSSSPSSVAAPLLPSVTGYPQVTLGSEVPIAYRVVGLACTAQSSPLCVQAVELSFALPPGAYQLLVHARVNESTLADVLYANATVEVSAPLLLSTGVTDPVLCDLLSNQTQPDPLYALSQLASLTAALTDAYGGQGFTQSASEWSCDGYGGAFDSPGDDNSSSSSSSSSSMGNSSSGSSNSSVADTLLTAIDWQLTAISAGDEAPLAINAVNALSQALLSIVEALTGSSSSSSSSAPTSSGDSALLGSASGLLQPSGATAPLSATQVQTILSATASVQAALAGQSIGYASGNQSALFIYNAAFDNLASLYGALLNASSGALHCGLLTSVQDRVSALLTQGMTSHQPEDVSLTFATAAFTAQSSRVYTDAAAVVGGGLSPSLPAAAFAGAASATLDVQQLLLSLSGSNWSACFPSSAQLSVAGGGGDTAGTATNLTLATVLTAAPLYVLELRAADGSEFAVSSLATPLSFALPFPAANASATLAQFTPTCAFFDTTTEAWSTQGCSSTPLADAVLCQCSHLTQFGLLAAPVTPELSDGRSQAAATEAAQHADLLGLFIIYLIPLVLATYLLTALLVKRSSGSTLSSSSTTATHFTVYGCLVAVALMRCVCLALLYFDDLNSATSQFNQNPLATTTTALLLIPAVAELVLLAALLYRYARIRRAEGAKRVTVNGRIDLRRASIYAGPSTLRGAGDQPEAELELSQLGAGGGRGRRQSMLQRLSVVTTSAQPVVAPPSLYVPLLFSTLYLCICVSALIAFLHSSSTAPLSGSSGSGSAHAAVEAVVVSTFLGSVTLLCVWLAFLYYSMPNFAAVMVRGQSFAWLPVAAFTLQSVLLLAFFGADGGSWYFGTSQGGQHATLAVYAVVELGTLLALEALQRWTVGYERAHAFKGASGRYEDLGSAAGGAAAGGAQQKQQKPNPDSDGWFNTVDGLVISDKDAQATAAGFTGAAPSSHSYLTAASMQRVLADDGDSNAAIELGVLQSPKADANAYANAYANASAGATASPYLSSDFNRRSTETDARRTSADAEQIALSFQDTAGAAQYSTTQQQQQQQQQQHTTTTTTTTATTTAAAAATTDAPSAGMSTSPSTLPVAARQDSPPLDSSAGVSASSSSTAAAAAPSSIQFNITIHPREPGSASPHKGHSKRQQQQQQQHAPGKRHSESSSRGGTGPATTTDSGLNSNGSGAGPQQSQQQSQPQQHQHQHQQQHHQHGAAAAPRGSLSRQVSAGAEPGTFVVSPGLAPVRPVSPISPLSPAGSAAEAGQGHSHSRRSSTSASASAIPGSPGRLHSHGHGSHNHKAGCSSCSRGEDLTHLVSDAPFSDGLTGGGHSRPRSRSGSGSVPADAAAADHQPTAAAAAAAAHSRPHWQ